MGGVVRLFSIIIFSVAFVFLALCGTAFATSPGNVSCGQALDSAGSLYTLNASSAINGSTCFNVAAANVTLDCNGFSITGNNSTSTYGVSSTAFNTTVKNCIVSNFSHAVYFNGAANGTIRNVTASTTIDAYVGIYIYSGSNNTIINSTGTATTTHGIDITSGSSNSIINSTGTATGNSGVGIYIQSNYNAIINSTGIILDSYGSGILITGSSNSISNSAGTATGTGGGNGIYLSTSSNCNVTNSTATAATNGISLRLFGTSTGNIFRNNTISSTANGTLLDINTTLGGNTFYWNNFTATSGLYVNDLNGGNFYNATISGHQEGNIWYNVMNGSVAIAGTANSTGFPSLYIGTVGAGYPYNSSTSAGKFSCNFAGCADYAPITPSFDCGCGVISEPNYQCTLFSSKSNASTCFTVNAANVTINCAGYSVTGSNPTNTNGVYSNQTSTTVKNCIISGFTSAIYFYTAANGTIQNTTATSFDDAILLEKSNYTTISNTTANATQYWAIKFNTYSNYNTIANTVATAASGFAILLSAGSNNKIINTKATATGDYAIYLSDSANGTIANTTANSTTNDAIYLYADSDNNTLSNNTLVSNGTLLLLDYRANGNTFYWNNFTATSGLYVNDTNGSNYYNATVLGHPEGNIWANVMNSSVLVAGHTISSAFPTLYLGAFGSGYPYNNTTAGGKLSGSVVDFAPFTPSNQLADTINLTLNGSSANISYTYSPAYNLAINASSASGTQSIYLNGTLAGTANYSPIFGAGYYNITANSSGNANYSAASVSYFANVSQAASAITLNATSWSVQSGASTTVNCTIGNSQSPLYLYRNGVQVGNSTAGGSISDTQALAAGTYNYTCNSTVSQNYTAAAENSSILTVAAALSSSPGNNNGGGSVGGGGSSGPATNQNEQAYPVDVGNGNSCSVKITRSISSTDSLSVLTTTLQNTGNSSCTLSNYAFTDTIPSNFTAQNITFSPSYASMSGSAVSFVFPSFAPGEARTITYSVNAWVPTSRLDGFTSYTMSADKEAVQPQANATSNQTAQPPPANVTSNTAMNDSKAAIDAAIVAIGQAKTGGKNASAAAAKLAEAQSAYGAGNYQAAIDLAISAKSLAVSAPLAGATQQITGASATGQPEWIVLLMLGAIVVIAAALYLYLQRRKRGKSPEPESPEQGTPEL